MAKIAALPEDTDKEDRMELMYALTFVAKWAPTPGGSHDRVTNIASGISLLIHEAHVISQTANKIDFSGATTPAASEMHLLRRAYQQHVLSPGRRFTSVPEPLMSSNRWSEIAYSRVPSICMNNNKETFFKHDEERFLNYLDDVKSGKKKISGATLLPHVLVMEAIRLHRQGAETAMGTTHSLDSALKERQRRLSETQMRVIDAQWAALVARLRESGQLDNCVAICDVSGSMGSLWDTPRRKSAFDVAPIWPALSLALLVARLAKPPFNDAFITFFSSPQFVTLDPESQHVPLWQAITGMVNDDWEMNTDFNAVFLDLILPLAVKHDIPKDQMIKRIFVFSDMQFDEANSKSNADQAPDSDGVAAEWKTNHDVISEAYTRAGYDVPELVYWNLSNTQDGLGITAPVTGDRQGVSLLGGYSPSLLKVFVDVDEEEWEVLDKEGRSRPENHSLTPEELMKKALGKKSYDALVVVD